MTDYKYETRDGKYWAEILRDDLRGTDYPVVALLTNKESGRQQILCLTKELLSFDGATEDGDLIPYNPARDWAVDEKIEVSEDGKHWVRAYFARFENGQFLTFIGGMTSFSVEHKGFTISWQYARKWEESGKILVRDDKAVMDCRGEE